MRAMYMNAYPIPARTALLMGILNVTPDSFSDGGLFATTEAAVAQGRLLAETGADIIDIGGESTRPGALAVSVEEELRRVIPVIERLKKETSATISIDTSKFEVAEKAVEAGASIINDVTACADIRMGTLVKARGLKICLMHMQGTPKDMQTAPVYPQGVVAEVRRFLEKKVRLLKELEIPKENIWVDPGFGFGKNVQHNLDLLRHLRTFEDVGGRLMVGTSRKSFLSKLDAAENADPKNRDSGTLASNLWAYSQGASVFRVHDVSAMKHALQTWNAVLVGVSS